MTAAIFGYAALFTGLLAAAAAAAEWGTEGRVARRHLWSAAILLAVLAPPAVVAWRTLRDHGRTAMAADEIATIVLTPRQAAPLAPHRAGIYGLDLHAAMRSVLEMISDAGNRNVTAALDVWLLLSFSLAAWLGIGMLRWNRIRRAWRRASVDGVEVDISPSTGPAVLGFVSQRIVLPVWATTMPMEHRRLVLAHECEHISARDPQRLALAIGVLVLMPWNVALWWCAARLRRAIELDCDARVLRRFPGAKDYGYVLLEVAARGRNTGPLAMPMVGLLRLPSELERRLRAMTRTRSAGLRMIAAGCALAFVAIGAAFTAPVPTAPSLAAAPAPRAAKPRARIFFRTLRVSLRAPSDTVPANAERKIDSGPPLLRTLPTKPGAADAGQLDMDPVAALRLAEQGVERRDSAQPSIAAGAQHRFIVMRTDAGPADDLVKLLARAEWRAQEALVDSAVAHYYPSLVAHPDERAVLWFVADSAGHVLQTKRDDTFARHTLMADSVPVRFPNVDVASIESVSLMRKDLGATSIRVTWTTLATPAR